MLFFLTATVARSVGVPSVVRMTPTVDTKLFVGEAGNVSERHASPLTRQPTNGLWLHEHHFARFGILVVQSGRVPTNFHAQAHRYYSLS